MANSTNTTTLPVNRTYKSTLFIMLFQDKNNLLELYNAVSRKHYTDPEILKINTLENAIYISKLYSRMTWNKNLYGTKIIRIPPHLNMPPEQIAQAVGADIDTVRKWRTFENGQT